MSAMPDSTLTDPQELIADLRRQLAECRAERDEAVRRETATAEVLQVINSSPGDLAPVFDAILEKALQRCSADCGALFTYDGACLFTVAHRGLPALAEYLARVQGPRAVGGDNAHGRLLRGEPVVHIPDIIDDTAYRSGDPMRRRLVDAGGRSLLAVPLRKEGVFLGDLVIYREELQPFSDTQIALLQNFAAQAVIAMENARLITETREALEQQTATAEVLGVINSSPGDLAPVFDTILEKAQSLCGAAFGLLFTYDGEHINAAALHNIPAGFAEFLQRGPVTPAPLTTLHRAVHERRPAQIVDVMAEAPYRDGDPFAVSAVKFGGVRTVLSIPLVKDEAVVGVIGLFRQEVRPFSEKQIALLKTLPRRR